ncbi:MAG TPA: hypothetical protein VG270_13255, partial [Pseudolabrys sp.]|nr:hypothetical protein [Pseudolabrys sp.]
RAPPVPPETAAACFDNAPEEKMDRDQITQVGLSIAPWPTGLKPPGDCALAVSAAKPYNSGPVPRGCGTGISSKTLG